MYNSYITRELAADNGSKEGTHFPVTNGCYQNLKYDFQCIEYSSRQMVTAGICFKYKHFLLSITIYKKRGGQIVMRVIK